MNKVSIFFDTNILETRHEESKLALSSIRLSAAFYKTLEFLKQSNLENRIELCIPEIVWLEIKEHMKTQFCAEYESVNTKVATYRKTFGDLIDITYAFRDIEPSNYPEYLSTIEEELLARISKNCHIVAFSRDAAMLDEIVRKAVEYEFPFRTLKEGKKKYHDAGFKDVVIFTSIEEYCEVNGRHGIFFTDDSDFFCDSRPKCAFDIIRTYSELETLLLEFFAISDAKLVEERFSWDRYLRETLLRSIEIADDNSLTRYKVDAVELVQDALYLVRINVIANEVEYEIDVEYDETANEITDIKYKMKDNEL